MEQDLMNQLKGISNDQIESTRKALDMLDVKIKENQKEYKRLMVEYKARQRILAILTKDDKSKK